MVNSQLSSKIIVEIHECYDIFQNVVMIFVDLLKVIYKFYNLFIIK